MPSAKVETEIRQHEHLFEIAASPETVWKAITDAAELVNWFPLDAVVDPGEGGRIIYGWHSIKGDSRIQAWRPPEHLRTSWMVHAEPGDDPRTQVAVDWFIEGERGQTRLRLVHSGFSMAKEWDEEYDGTRRGWDFEL